MQMVCLIFEAIMNQLHALNIIVVITVLSAIQKAQLTMSLLVQ